MSVWTKHPKTLFYLGLTLTGCVVLVFLLSAEPFAGAESPARQDGGVRHDAVVVVPIRLATEKDGLALVDREKQTICIYHYDLSRAAHERLVLLAARSYRYDTDLEDFNNAEPRPAMVRELILQSGGQDGGSAKPVRQENRAVESEK